MKIRMTLPDRAAGTTEKEDEPLNIQQWLIPVPESSFFMRISGSQLEGAGVRDGDMLVVSRETVPREQDLVIVERAGELVVRLLTNTGGRWRLNTVPAQSNAVVDDADLLSLGDVWGVVTGMARKFRDDPPC